ncbi:hypothetical protein KFK09_028571 [Dendrobium nobile]|uniref:Uncharacterized protein n=1 Tax=Dendrobium nobile TaxID=94219 RepID=A0A8T3A3N7_DENNO|nr:hypothetical protein KFK09_028571 [Dendrobium nobile]
MNWSHCMGGAREHVNTVDHIMAVDQNSGPVIIDVLRHKFLFSIYYVHDSTLASEWFRRDLAEMLGILKSNVPL